ncbi:hypothetical protein [Bacillus velezensis]|uniref:hypothetical protein n=1 Tax=Bacillus velezensis TaxID=492670 RepID=UPI000BA61C46|nr:hypothetical protein [Bacillus velezensis]PAE74494.1 hypothetical protein CHH82_19535 [Bacillus velezensis]HEO2443817.1 hypothetical protein [Streptococcus agalactiae]
MGDLANLEPENNAHILDETKNLLSLWVNSRERRGIQPSGIDLSNVKTLVNYLRFTGSISKKEEEMLRRYYD